MKRYLWLFAFCAVCFGQPVAPVSPNSQTGFDITLYSQYANYTLYRGKPSLWGNLGQGGYVEYQVSATAGGYGLQLYFANGTSTGGTVDIAVNGASQPTLSVPSTGSWANFQMSPVDTIVLPSGTSTLRIAASNPVQAFNLAGMLMNPARSSNVVAADALSGVKFYVNPYSPAAENINLSCSNGASLAKIAAQPSGVWFGNWNTNPRADVATVMALAASRNSVPILVAYDIVDRDCGGQSSGGAASDLAYENWIQQLALGIGTSKAVVVLEPDALSQMSVQGCLNPSQQNERYSLLQYAVSMFQQHATNTLVYLDAGNSNAIDANTMAERLQFAGVAHAAGFALNVSNYETTASNTAYGEQLSSLVGGKHFIIDTSRNGAGPSPDHQWCNPPERGLGTPSQGFGSGLVDAYLWVQNPGTSDGACNGGPAAGTFSAPIACTLSQNAVF